MSSLKFSHEHRLTDRPDFVRCYDNGRRFFSSGFVLFAVPREAVGLPWRLGLAVTKKTGRAVWRNRVRRLIRECFRLEQEKIPAGFDLVVVPKRALDPRSLTLSEVRAQLLPLIISLMKKTANHRAATDSPSVCVTKEAEVAGTGRKIFQSTGQVLCAGISVVTQSGDGPE